MDALKSSSEVVASAGQEAPLITVAICTRNRARFLREAIESVLPQLRNNTEFLVVDNGSTDETAEVVGNYAARCQSLRLISEPLTGVSHARNAALRHARGQYVLFLDDDDKAAEGWLDAYYQTLSSPPLPNLAGAGGPVLPWYQQPPPRWLDPRANTLNWADTAQRFKERGGPWNCNLALDRRQALAVGGYNVKLGRHGKSMGAHEEAEMFEKLRHAGGVFWWLPQARIQYRVHPERLTIRFMCRSEFTSGRSSARYRLPLIPGALNRMLFRVGRLAVAPLQMLLCLLAAAAVFPFDHGRVAAGLLFRASRTAGFAAGLAAWRPVPSP